MIRKVALLLVVAVVLIGILVASQLKREPLKVSGVIEADEIRLGSRVGGRVRTVHVDEGDEVGPEDVLIELDPFDLLERQAEAKARWEEASARHRKLKAGYRPDEIAAAEARYRQLAAQLKKLEDGARQEEIDTAAAELRSAKTVLVLAEKLHERAVKKYEEKVISAEELDRFRQELDAARADTDAKQKQLDLLNAGTRQEEIDAAKAARDEAEAEWNLKKKGYRDEEVDEAYAAMMAAQSALAVIDRQVDELKVVSPVPGTVQAVDLQPGDLVNANAPVLSLLDMSHLWVRAYVPENRLNLSLEQKVKITVDSFPEEEFTGEISFISHEAEFTPRNVQTPEERSKQVFRIKVKLVEGLERLRPGMEADVWLEER